MTTALEPTTLAPGIQGHANHAHALHHTHGSPAHAQADIAAANPSVAHQARPAPPGCRGPVARCKALLDNTTDASGRSSENDVPCNSSNAYGGSYHAPPRSDAQGACCPAQLANGRERATCTVAVRVTERSNGLPLATIIERNSLSTLHSHGSLPSVTCRYPLPNQHGNTAASGLHSHRGSRNLEDTTLHMIQEHANHEPDAQEGIDDPSSQNVGPAMPCTESPITARDHQQGQQAESAQLEEAGNDGEGKGLKRLLRGVIQHVRSVSRRSESRSSFLASSSPDRPAEHDNVASNVESQDGHVQKEPPDGTKARPADVASVFTDRPELPHCDAAGNWADDCERSLNDPETAVRDIPTIRHVPPDKAGHPDEVSRPSGSQTPSLRSSTVRDGGPPCATSAARDEVPSSTMSGTTALSPRTGGDEVTRYTFDGTPIYRSTGPSLYDYDQARNTSFCSTTTISTTYSSAVLGIDLDLHYSYPPAGRRASTPAWFGAPSAPNPSGENNDSGLSSPSDAHCRSITSAVLPLLLPIAAASGIIQPNDATAGLSFYSPTGNLIQADDSQRSPRPSIEQYRNVLQLSYSEPSARPAAVPLTTPPHSSMPLPSHLRQQKQNQQAHHCHTRSHIVPQTVMTTNNVKGCGGVVRTSSLTPRSGVRRPPSIHQHARTASASADTFRSRFHAVACCTSPNARNNRVPKMNKVLCHESEIKPQSSVKQAPPAVTATPGWKRWSSRRDTNSTATGGTSTPRKKTHVARPGRSLSLSADLFANAPSTSAPTTVTSLVNVGSAQRPGAKKLQPPAGDTAPPGS